MNVWLTLFALAFLAVIYVLVPVGAAMSAHYRRPKLVRCPLTGRKTALRVERAGVAEALGRRSLRRVSYCSLWPERRHCPQSCLELPEEEIREFRVGVRRASVLPR
jgi:hypothetical protein